MAALNQEDTGDEASTNLLLSDEKDEVSESNSNNRVKAPSLETGNLTDTDAPKGQMMLASDSNTNNNEIGSDNNEKKSNNNTQSMKEYYAQKTKFENEETDKHANFGFDEADRELLNKLQLIETSSHTPLERARRKLQVQFVCV